MIFISLKRKDITFVVLAVIISLTVLTIYSSAKIVQNENKYQSVLCMTRMFDDTHFIAYITDEEVQRETKNIEVFDISKGEVIIKSPISMDIQNEVINYVKAIKGLYTKAIPFPNKGYVIRVPFEPPVNVKVKLVNDSGIKSIDSVFIIISDKEAPIILILDERQRPYFFTFNASIQPLLDYLKLKPEQLTTGEADADSGADIETED